MVKELKVVSTKLVIDKTGKGEKIINLSGFIEKIQVLYPEEPEIKPSEETELIIETNHGELVLGTRGNTDFVVYPRSKMHGAHGEVLTFDGLNPFPTKFYCSSFLKITGKFSQAKEVEISSISIYYWSNEDSFDIKV